ncbi:MAG: FliA/WhiG family RNA polymerase sigma factor [Defluviitaleaceae bacterium]|nr:FliA/WhiG family RNA polymerase sigma factor [Defluviitaleaceae bacterium]
MALKNTDIDIDKIWETYLRHKDESSRQAAKEELIVHYSPMIKYVVGRLNIYTGTSLDREDLVSSGIFGLIDAIEKFNNMKGVKFETYASLRIRGAVLDSIRALDWVPRTQRQKSRQLDAAYTLLESELGREPYEEELAERMKLSVEQLQDEIKKSSLVSLVSLDDYLDQNHESNFEPSESNDTSPELVFEKEELKQEMAEAIKTLSDKEQMVVALYYYEELTLKEISKVLQVSESRVSQIHSKAMLKMRTKLERHKSLLLT